MPRPTTRDEVLARLRKTVAEGSIIVGAGAGETFVIPGFNFSSLCSHNY